ncbi:FKBP-type peptidyl-prolyl cis-trans isomerase [bacterium]|nr:FKBP-type peptidyl-prolyl cis-trans isomerase [bacterium]
MTNLSRPAAAAVGILLVLAGCGGERGPVWVELEPGLSYADSIVGTGTEVRPDDYVVVHYTGFLWADGARGARFESSVDAGEPIDFPLGRNIVIAGWEKGLPGMRAGGRRTLLVGPELAFGAVGNPPLIPPDATLCFDIELLAVPRVEVQVTEAGDGPVAELGDNVSVEYTGWLWQDGAAGAEFASSRDRGAPFRFTLGAGQVIAGWDAGIPGLAAGTRARLVIPAVMGHGREGSPPTVPPAADLVFDIELVEIAGK